MLTLDLPVPPSSNNAYINVRGRGRVPSKDHTRWKKDAGRIALEQFADWGCPEITTPYRVLILVNINRKSDIANREKLLTDMLVKNNIIRIAQATSDVENNLNLEEAKTPDVL